MIYDYIINMKRIVNRIKNINKVVPIYNKSNMIDKATNTEMIYSEVEIQKCILRDIDDKHNIVYICRKYDKIPEYIAFVMLTHKHEINFIQQFTGLDITQILLSYLKY